MSAGSGGLARRDVLCGTAALLVAAGADDRAFAKTFPAAFAGALRPVGADAFKVRPVGRQSLWLRRPDGEEIMLPYRDEAAYDRGAIMQLSWFLRDTGDAGKAVWMEPRLFDLLAGVQSGLSSVAGTPVPLVVTSGYRTPTHNARVETAARNSMHLYGYAVDLHAPSFSPRAVGLAASFFASGGIGLYDTFTHLDVWRVRTWVGPAQAAVRPGQGVADPRQRT